MKMTIHPGQALLGNAVIPGDKSISHRAALFAAIAMGQSEIRNFLVSGVSIVMLEALRALGIAWSLDGNTLQVEGKGLHGFRSPAAAIDCGNSATTMRLLAGTLAASGTAAVLDGSESLRKRPMERVTRPLQSLGVPIVSAAGGVAPLILAERQPENLLSGQHLQLAVASAQVKTAIILAALSADSEVVVTEPALSRDHTERMLHIMGVNIHIQKENNLPAVQVTPLFGKTLWPLNMDVPGDFSAASFLIVAALITPGSNIQINGVGLNPARIGLLSSLQEMGADLQINGQRSVSGEPVGDLRIRHTQLHGIVVQGERVVQMIDEFPVFAVAAAYAQGKTTVLDAQELRHKESDRIAGICKNLQALGVDIQETPDGFIVDGKGIVPGGGSIDPHRDHRLAMAMMVAGLSSQQPVKVEHAEIIQESFPDFPTVLHDLGTELCVEGGEE